MKPFGIFCLIGLCTSLPTLLHSSTKKFQLDLTWETRSPDGVPREMALVNGEYPGPSLIFDEGDDVEVVVNNYLPYNTTIHYHGIQ